MFSIVFYHDFFTSFISFPVNFDMLFLKVGVQLETTSLPPTVGVRSVYPLPPQTSLVGLHRYVVVVCSMFVLKSRG